jgi:hypothetical protein
MNKLLYFVKILKLIIRVSIQIIEKDKIANLKPELSNSLINLSVKLVLIRAKTIVSMKDEMMEKTGFVYLK